MFKQVVRYIEGNGLLHPSHHGSRSQHSTCTAIIEMYDTWVDSADNGEMGGVMMIDLSAAFDLVDHSLLLQKLDLLGFDKSAIVWFWSYLTARSQCVYVDGQLSEFASVDVGVPQGSVLGPLMYILFVNDLPEVVHGHPGQAVHGEGPNQAIYNMNCSSCGGLCCYVDDSTYMFSSTDAGCLSDMLSEQYRKLSDYMGDNRLVINDDKTHLIVMGTLKYKDEWKQVNIDTGTVVIKPKETEKLLGLHIHQSLKWGEHILNNEKSMLKTLATRLGALKKISVNASFQTRLMVANSCFISIISYLISVWGGTEAYIIRAVQVMQNKAARCITKKSWYTSTGTLLLQCNWLSMKQLVTYHTVLQVWKVKTQKAPIYLQSKIQASVTRSEAEGTLGVNVETSLAGNSFMVRSALAWNSVQPDIRSIQKLQQFKSKLMKWIKANIDIE